MRTHALSPARREQRRERVNERPARRDPAHLSATNDIETVAVPPTEATSQVERTPRWRPLGGEHAENGND